MSPNQRAALTVLYQASQTDSIVIDPGFYSIDGRSLTALERKHLARRVGKHWRITLAGLLHYRGTR